MKSMMDFNVEVTFNMQFSLVSRSLINQLKKYGSFYQSPYPDYYATTALLLKAEKILAVACPMVVIGISPKSFGYYYFNNKEKLGQEFLGNFPDSNVLRRIKRYLLPGTNMNTSWLLAMETIKVNFSKEFLLKVNYRKYRFLQILQHCKRVACREEISREDFWILLKKLSLWEKVVYAIPMVLISLLVRWQPSRAAGNGLATKMLYAFSHPSHGEPRRFTGVYDTILDVYNKIDLKQLPEYDQVFKQSPLTSFEFSKENTVES